MSAPDKLTFGYIYDFRNPPQWHRPWAEHYAATLDFIAWTETAGFTGAWVPEHHTAEDGYIPSPMIPLAAIAARTSKIKLGTGIALAPLHHPVRFAEDAALLDIMSNGRLEIQLAIGYRKRETAMYGVDFKKRGRIFNEFLDIVTRLWSGETVSFEGEFYNIQNARIMPPPLGRIPLYIGGFAEKALERVVKYGDGYFGDPRSSEIYKEKLRAAGKDPESARIRIPDLFTAVAKDPAEALDELAPCFHHVNNSYAAWNHEDRKDGQEGPELALMSLEEYKASNALNIITPGEAIDKFKRMKAKIPLEHVMMALPAGMPPEKFRKYAKIFAEEVIPAFA